MQPSHRRAPGLCVGAPSCAIYVRPCTEPARRAADNRRCNYGAQQLDSAGATLAQAQAAVSDGAKRYARVTDGYVHENPWIALGVAAAAGLLIGAVLARR